MRTATPWWISVVVAVGLLFVYIGERAFGHVGTAATIITWIGVLLVGGATAVRGVGFAMSRGKRRTVELILLLCQVGVLLALAIYALAPEATGDAKEVARREIIVTITWSILLVVSLMPLLMAEVALGAANREELVLSPKDDGSEASVDSYRVKAMASSGLTIALAAAFLMVTCNVAEQRNMSKDVSYFRTASPGGATVAMTRSISEPLVVYLFFPDVNEVRTQVRGYFDSLANKTGNVEIHEHDRMISSDVAEKFKVTAEGTIVLARGDKFETFTVNEDMQKARRNELRNLDETVQKTLMKVIRDKRVAYMTVGHGELNDAGSAGALAAKNPAQAQIVKTILSRLNYQVKDLARDTLTVDVPEDASMVLVLGPLAPMMDEELEALDRYLGRGGSLMLALDPQRKADLGALSGRLGVTWNATALADDDRPLRMRGSVADNVVIV
ncbi:MAG TPA: Gldg family protein, partial [Kofleriaceae bacterium]|nr:Gldg family protein [Kofleriaceae bacterium]